MPTVSELRNERCGACWHFERCRWLIHRRPEDYPCDWIPSRHVSSKELAVGTLQLGPDFIAKTIDRIDGAEERGK